SISGDQYSYLDKDLTNSYIKKLRYKYWKTLFQSDTFSQLLTTDLYEQYMEKLEELQDYDFSMYNIETIRKDIEFELITSIERTILELFDKFTHKHSYYATSTNIHYYNGWKTNKSYRLNEKKVIIPLNGYDSWSGMSSFYPTRYSVVQQLQDIEKV